MLSSINFLQQFNKYFMPAGTFKNPVVNNDYQCKWLVFHTFFLLMIVGAIICGYNDHKFMKIE